MRVDAATREITCKIVYYGPGMSGKTTNLQQLHERAPSRSVGELVTLDTHSERTLHFDLLPMDVGQVDGHAVRFEFYTVPGQSYYASTRRLVLEGADAIVFVADSRREALDENIDSMNDLFDNWRHLGLPEDLPVVLQYNKQDLGSALKPEQLDPLLNSRRWHSHTAVAVNCVGVIETMKTIAAMVMERVRATVSSSPSGTKPVLPSEKHSAPKTWLITCHRCQSMLEITGARKGDLFTCGSCGAPLEISDLDRGLTRIPQQQAQQPIPIPSGPSSPAHTTHAPMSSAPSASRDDSGGYSLQPLSATGSGALGHGSSGAHGTADLGSGFELAGFESLALLEETVQARRFRVREVATGTRYRAAVLTTAMMRQPGYAGEVDPYVRMAAKVRHGNILSLHSLHQGRETPILLSQDASDHESLSHVLARRRVLAPPHAIIVAKQIALACEEASRQGVVHGWLRPEVILLNAESQVLVDDFGIPKQHFFLTRELSGASAATEYYLAPEHLKEDARSDVRSDMFMLGALLFRMLTGEGLVTGYTCHEALHKVSAQGCRAARTAQPNLSRDLDAFISRLVAINRDERFETWKQVVDLLDRFGGGAKVQTFRLTQTHRNTGGTGTVRRSAPARSGTASHSGTAGIQRPQTGSIARQQTGGFSRPTASHRNPSGGEFPANRATGSYARKPQGGNGGLFIVLILLLVAAAIVIVYMLGNPRRMSPPVTAPTTPAVQPVVQSTGQPPAVVPPTSTAPVSTGPKGGASAPRMPGFMGGGPVSGGPATDPHLLPVVAGTDTKPDATPEVKPEVNPEPEPAVAEAPKTISDEDFARIRIRITDALREEHFRAALDLCEQLPLERRQALSADIYARHQGRRAAIAEEAKKNPGQARTLLENALKNWNMPGDAEWAQEIQRSLPAETSPAPAPLGQPGVPPSNPANGASSHLTPPATLPTGTVDAAQVAWQVNQQLVANLPVQATQALRTLPADNPDIPVLQRRIDLWQNRVDILKPALAEKRRALRITNPQDGQGWDVVGIEAGGLQITSATGSTTRMDWSLLPIKEFSRIAMEVSAARKEADPRECGLAIVLLTAANDTALAQVHLNRTRAQLGDGLANDLERSIALQRAFATKAQIAKTDEALAGGDLKTASECIEALHRLRNDALVAEALPRLEESLTRLQNGKPAASGSTPLRDHLTFASADDEQSLPLRQGTWTVANGTISPEGTSGSIGRKDLGNVKSATILFQSLANRGAITFYVRDVRILLDLSAQKMTASTRDIELKPTDVQIVPRTVQNLYVEFRADGHVLVELNNGVISLDLRQQKAGDQMTIAYDTGASFAIDEILLKREEKLDPAAEAQRIAALNAIGFEPLGRAILVPPAIVLPESQPRSGIAFVRRQGVASITFEVQGTGKIEVRFGKMNEGGGQAITLDLGATPTDKVTYTVGCGKSMWVRRGGPDGEEFVSDTLRGDPPHVMIVALQEATITSTPRLNRQ